MPETATEPIGRRVDRLTLLLGLFVIPAALGVFGQLAIFEIFGDDGTLRGSPGTAVLYFVTSPLGGPLVAATLAGGVAFVRVRRAGAALIVAGCAAVLFWAYRITFILIAIFIFGANLD